MLTHVNATILGFGDQNKPKQNKQAYKNTCTCKYIHIFVCISLFITLPINFGDKLYR